MLNLQDDGQDSNVSLGRGLKFCLRPRSRLEQGHSEVRFKGLACEQK